ncbi:MAG: 6-carboxytetrahydropterin synthase [Gemmatimonadota bacterium]|nr:6-carboxytetrahydropterin synthase [Gemmatimonadota bacterium]
MNIQDTKMPVHAIRVEKECLGFAAGHFITYGGGQCETLHGHNYRTGVELTGPLDAHGLVVDFVMVKRELEGILRPLDHRMLLPTGNPALSVERRDGSVEVRHGDRRYVFPEEDVAFLPVANTTAELLAGWIAERLVERLAAHGVSEPDDLVIEVEESFGQSATVRRTGGRRTAPPAT